MPGSEPRRCRTFAFPETRKICGANGVSDRYPVERYFRDARKLTFPDGTSEIHQLLIGRGATGLDAFRG